MDELTVKAFVIKKKENHKSFRGKIIVNFIEIKVEISCHGRDGREHKGQTYLNIKRISQLNPLKYNIYLTRKIMGVETRFRCEGKYHK